MGINIDISLYLILYLILFLYVFTPVSVGHLLLRGQDRYQHYTTPKTRFILSYAIGLLCTFTAGGIILLFGLSQQFFFVLFGASVLIVGVPVSRLAAKRIEVSSEIMYISLKEKDGEYKSDSLDDILSTIMKERTAKDEGARDT